MKLSNNRAFNTFISVYILITILFVGRIFLDMIVTPKDIKESTVPVLSQEKIDIVSKKLDQRKILTATESATPINFEFGKAEPFR